MRKDEKRRLLLLSAILMVVSLVATSLTLALLYHSALEDRRQALVILAQSQARLIEEDVRYDFEYSQWLKEYLPDYDPLTVSLNQIISALKQTGQEFGNTGEFVLAQKVDQRVVVHYRSRAARQSALIPVRFDPDYGQPMMRALSGKSGSMIGPDYTGTIVIAAYEPVAAFNLGIVAKIDLAEVREPFLLAAIIAFSLTTVLILAGVLMLRRAIEPLFDSLRQTTRQLSAEIDQHKQSLAALQESEARFLQIADMAEDVLWLVDCTNPKRLKFLYASRAFEKIWQRPVDNLLQNISLWFAAIHPEDSARIRAEYKLFMRGEGVGACEYRLCRPDGEIRYLATRGGVIRNAAGEIVRIAGSTQDITAIRNAERAVQEANLQLEIRVEERTADLQRTINLMAGRELRMAELKLQLQQLEAELQTLRG